MGKNEIVTDAVEFFGRHAWTDMREDHVQRFGRKPTGPAHALEMGFAMKFDASAVGIGFRVSDRDIVHHAPGL
jgi:hypothetical protein